MPQGTKISFVVWPDGKVDEQSLTVSGERFARESFIASYLPERFFGKAPRDYIADRIWDGAREKGFRSYTIEIGIDGNPILAES
jgi:hypothetical protein